MGLTGTRCSVYLDLNLAGCPSMVHIWGCCGLEADVIVAVRVCHSIKDHLMMIVSLGCQVISVSLGKSNK